MKRIFGIFMSIFIALIGLGVILFGMSSSSVMAEQPETPKATIIVNTLDDELNSDGDCSLREAITAVNENVPVDTCPSGYGVLTDTISFNMTGTITLTERLSVTVGGPLVIDGSEAITVSGGRSVRIFYVGYGAQLSLNQLTVADGFPAKQKPCEINFNLDGGGIENYGSLKIFDSKILKNVAVCSDGGGIANYGVLEIFDSTISDNFVYPGSGSGIANHGFLSIANTTLINNLVGGGYGSGIWNEGILYITNTIFSDNIAVDFGGGGIYNSGFLTITNSTFSNNAANDRGGGIENIGTAQIINSQFIGNQASDGGGVNNTGRITISNSTFNENNANMGGAILMDTTDADTSVYVYNNTFSLNYADGGGAIYVDGNSAQDKMRIANTTFVSNIADSGGALYRAGGVVEVFNSVLTDSPFDENCSGWILDESHNIDSGDSCSFDPANGSMINTDPLVGPLQNNGGDTPTHALLEGSPAIDAADPQYCPSADQRGVPRPIDGNGDGKAACDIGAYELRQVILLYPTSQTGGGIPGMMVTYTLVLYNDTPLTDTYTLTSGSNEWQTNFSTPSIGPLMPGTSGTFIVSVAIPEDAILGMTDTVVISATSLTSPTIYSTTAHITTRVRENMYLPQILQSAGNRLEETSTGASAPVWMESIPGLEAIYWRR